MLNERYDHHTPGIAAGNTVVPCAGYMADFGCCVSEQIDKYIFGGEVPRDISQAAIRVARLRGPGAAKVAHPEAVGRLLEFGRSVLK